ncbi:MAG: sulfotransferase, partial [Pseudomonadota bacterium]
GVACFSAHDRQGALNALQSAVDIAPQDGDVQLNLGQLYKSTGETAKAKTALQRAIAVKQLDPEPIAELAEILLAEEQWAQAAELAVAAYRLAPDNAMALKTLTIACRYLGKLREALVFGRELIALTPSDSAAYVALAAACVEVGKIEESTRFAREAVALDPFSAQALAVYAEGAARGGRWDDALECIDRALALEPDCEEFIVQKAAILRLNGDDEGAFAMVKPLVEGREAMKSSSLELYLSLAERFGEQLHAVNLLEGVLQGKDMAATVRLSLSFAAGDLYATMGRSDEAFAHYQVANRLKARTYDFAGQEALFRRTREVFSAAALERMPSPSVRSTRPIFIVGMPRAGTSLTEKILASHSRVFGGGELTGICMMCANLPGTIDSQQPYPDCIDDLSAQHVDALAQGHLDFLSRLDPAGHDRVTDKMPQNFFFLGVIAKLFPDAIIIHCKRDPLDTCLSCYTKNFAIDGLEFAYSLESLGHYYKLYQELMAHWHEVLPGRIYDLDYEALVSDSETQIRRLVEHCGLTFEDACLAPHESAHRTVTASH